MAEEEEQEEDFESSPDSQGASNSGAINGIAKLASGAFNLPGKQKKSEKEKQEELKALKTNVQQDAKKDPYAKHHLLKKNVQYAAGRNDSIKEKMQNFNKEYAQKRKIAERLQGTNSLEEAQNINKQYQQQEKEEKSKSRSLQTAVLKENAKRIAEGPRGCLKDMKGCLSTSAVVCLTFMGGLVVGILALCGVF